MKRTNCEWENILKLVPSTKLTRFCLQTNTPLAKMSSNISIPSRFNTSRYLNQQLSCLNQWKELLWLLAKQCRALTRNTTWAKKWEKTCSFTAVVQWKSTFSRSCTNSCLQCILIEMKLRTNCSHNVLYALNK